MLSLCVGMRGSARKAVGLCVARGSQGGSTWPLRCAGPGEAELEKLVKTADKLIAMIQHTPVNHVPLPTDEAIKARGTRKACCWARLPIETSGAGILQRGKARS